MAKPSRPDHRLSKQQIAVGVVVALLAAFLYDFGSLVLRARDLDLQAEDYQKQNKALQEQSRDLQQRLDYVRSDEYVRSAAPDVLLWGDPNSKYVMPVDPTPGAPRKTP